MTLHEWQSSLVELVHSHASKSRESDVALPESLSREEQRWLDALPDAAGFQLTCGMQRWWRHYRLRTSAPLTLAGLGPERASQVLDAFLDTCPRKSMFVASEALRFLEFAAERCAEVPHLADVVAFERAMLRLAEPTSTHEPAAETDPPPALLSEVAAHPLAEVVAFAAPPEEVLGAVLGRRPLPGGGAREHWLLLAPRLPRGARAATPAEAWLFQAVRAGETARLSDLDHAAALADLWAAGAVVRAEAIA